MSEPTEHDSKDNGEGATRLRPPGAAVVVWPRLLPLLLLLGGLSVLGPHLRLTLPKRKAGCPLKADVRFPSHFHSRFKGAHKTRNDSFIFYFAKTITATLGFRASTAKRRFIFRYSGLKNLLYY